MNLDEHIARVANRARAFERAAGPGHFLVVVQVPADAPAIPPLYGFDLDRQLDQWLDHKLEASRPAWAAKAGIDDDSIPNACPHFGIAEHVAWLGLDVRLQQDNCLLIPSVHSITDVDRMDLRTDTRWFGYMTRGYDYLRSRKDGTFVLSVRGTGGPMDLANLVRGDDLFSDFIENKPFAHRLMEFFTEAIPWYFDQLVSWADELDGGHVFMHSGGWMDAGTLGHLSNDAAMLCSPEIYREFGLPYESRLVSPRYRRALYHIHNQHLHYVPDLVRLPRLSLLEVSTDPKTKPPIEDLPRIETATGGTNLMLTMDSAQLRSHLGELGDRNALLRVRCRDRHDAQDVVRAVRAASKPL